MNVPAKFEVRIALPIPEIIAIEFLGGGCEPPIFPNSNVIWNLYGFHMGTHVAYIWYFMWFAPDHPYGHHIGKPYGFYVGTIWYTHVVYNCETHMGKPYVCHMSDIWLTHVTPIWVVGCKPHEIPHVYHCLLYTSPSPRD